jgi:hypothetical protein
MLCPTHVRSTRIQSTVTNPAVRRTLFGTPQILPKAIWVKDSGTPATKMKVGDRSNSKHLLVILKAVLRQTEEHSK